ncbi:MAG: hypothetical protein ACRCYQ_01380 [Nocardioides sp.]
MTLSALAPSEPLHPQRALRLLRVAFLVMMVAYFIGGGWDAEYHRTQPFDGFFSPPHLFIYTLVAVLIGLVVRLIMDQQLCDCFPPGALILLGGGCAGFALAGPLDALWHTIFGLDETQWSLPHSMIGQSLGLLTLGFLACRLSLDWHRRTWPATRYLLGYLVVFAAISVLGPLQDNPTAAAARRSGSVGALADDAASQRLVRMIVDADLTHAHPAYPVLAAWWCATAIAILRGLDRRVRYWFVVTLLVAVSLAGAAAGEAEDLRLAADEATSTGLPLFTALVVFGLAWRLPDRWRYALAGLGVGLHAWSVWGDRHPGWYVVALLATPAAALAGRAIGLWIADLTLRPTARRAVVLVIVMVLIVPLATGSIDLYLRVRY